MQKRSKSKRTQTEIIRSMKRIDNMAIDELKGDDEMKSPWPIVMGCGESDENQKLCWVSDKKSFDKTLGKNSIQEFFPTVFTIGRNIRKREIIAALDELKKAIEKYWGAFVIDPLATTLLVEEARKAIRAEDTANPPQVIDSDPHTWPEERYKTAENRAYITATLGFMKLDPEKRDAWIKRLVSNLQPQEQSDVFAWFASFERDLNLPSSDERLKPSEANVVENYHAEVPLAVV